MKDNHLVELGIRCKRFRRKIGIKQKQVAIETGYSDKTISMFETGRVNNAKILYWYIRHGLPVDNNEGGILWHVKE